MGSHAPIQRGGRKKIQLGGVLPPPQRLLGESNTTQKTFKTSASVEQPVGPDWGPTADIAGYPRRLPNPAY